MNNPKIPSVGQMRHELFVKGGEVLPHHQREANKAKGGVVSLLRKHGRPVESDLDAMRKMSNGHRVFVAHEQDEMPTEIHRVSDMHGYTPDQIYTVDPKHFAQHKAKGGQVSQDAMRLAVMNKAESDPANKRMIEDVYGQYPVHPFNPNQRAMVEGEGEDQTLGTFELKPSMSARNAVELDWLSAYPHKQGVGSRTLKKLQEHAIEHGVGLTLFPWEHGGVSQSKLIKFYKKHGFMPTTKGGKAMIWRPEEKSHGGATHAHHLDIEERPL